MKENKLVTVSIVFIALVVLAIVLKNFQQVMRPLAIATLLFFMVTPLARFSKQKKIPTWITFSGLFLCIFLILSQVSSLVSTEHLDFENTIPAIQEKIQQDSGGLLALAKKFGFGTDALTSEKLSKWAGKGAAMGLQGARAIFSETLLALILLMFLIPSATHLFDSVETKFGSEEALRLRTTFQKIEGDIIAYFGTKAMMSLGTAIGTGIVLFLFKAKFISISLMIIFLLNFIPVIGSLVAVVIIVVLFGVSFGLSATLGWFFLSLMAVQILFGSILEPKIAGDRLDMSPILIIVSLYVWGWIWGVVGMLLSVPLTILILIIIKHVRLMKAEEVN
jgi:AI-2 transport protein TqsA